MPLFGNKFSPKKGTPRRTPSLSNLNLDASERQVQFGDDFGPIKVRLGSQEMYFDGGNWVADGIGGGMGGQKDIVHLKKKTVQLTEENNLLKFKNEVLLDMLAETTAELHLKDNEIDQLKKAAKRK